MNIVFNVRIQEDKYSYSNCGEAEAIIEIPLELITTLDTGNIFQYLMKCAVDDYHKKKEDEDEK